ncbi:amino acid-binding protein, partial [Halobacteriales archaeon QH_3_68_24]
EATPDRFDGIVEALREAGINVIQAGSRRYGESLTLVLSGHVVDTDLSDTLSRIHETTQATVTDLSLSAPEGTEDESSARLRLATEENERRATLAAVREIADEKGLRVIEPLAGGDQ